MKRESFIFYKSFYESIKELAPEEQAQIYNAIFEYQFENNVVELKGVCKSIFTLIIPQLDANNKRYINGCKGGAPKGNKNATKKQPKNNQKTTKKQPKNNQKTTKKQPNDNENVNDNENNNNIIIRDSFEKNESKTQNNNGIIKEIVNYLNTCGEYEKFEKVIKFRYKYTSNYIRKIITARINEGYNIEDFKDVIFNCYKKFVVNEFIGLNNKSSIQYYNPEVMFTSEKMVKYLNEYDSIR